MTTLLLFSDSHGRTRKMQEAYDLQPKKPNGILYMGDGLLDLERCNFGDTPLYAVRGNCDGDNPQTAEMVLEFEKTRFLVVHGHLLKAKYGDVGLVCRALEVGADVVVYGHTHKKRFDYLPEGETILGKPLEKPLYLCNPGSIANGDFGTLALDGKNILFGS